MNSISKFLGTYLEPAERLSEVLFGLIMVISITNTVNIIIPKAEETVGDLLKAALGCNVAWGIVDGVFYILNSLMRRSQRLKIIQKVHDSKNLGDAFPWIADKLDSLMTPLVDSADKERLYQAIYKRLSQIPPEKGRLLKEDVMGAIVSFWLVFLSTFPVVIPFMVLHDPALALKVSNIIALILLFVLGYRWGLFAMVRPLRPALGMVVIGVVLIAITIALGG